MKKPTPSGFDKPAKTSGETGKPLSNKAPAAKAAASAASKSAKSARKKADPAPPASAKAAPPASADAASKTVRDRETGDSRATGAVRALAWMSLVLAMLIIIGGVSMPWWSDRLAAALPFLGQPASPDDPLTSALTGRLDALEERARNLESERSTALEALEKTRAGRSRELAALMSRIQGLEAGLAEIRQVIDSSASIDRAKAADKSIRALSERLSRLEGGGGRLENLADRLDRLEKSGAETAREQNRRLTSQLREVNRRLRELEETPPPAAGAEAARARAIILALVQLRDRVRQGGPFEADLEALRAVLGDVESLKPALASLRVHAKTGAPALSALKIRFPEAAAGAAAASGVPVSPASGGGWIDRARVTVSQLVKSRRTGAAAEPGSADALLNEAEDALDAGDLEAAMSILRGLPEPSKAPLADWFKAAETRLGVERALAGLNGYAVSLLPPANAGG